MTAQLSLPICACLGCQLITEIPGTPCQDCVKAFGDMLRPGRPLTEDEITKRDEAVKAAYRTARLRGVL
ncbi:hypothetical protein [Mycobacterium sp. CnD-18-1]|uniref:hypothetical protein n=1 Tax=Mycobacterium sp. CnD-18-1 TaxID=2917744 RepID=UPI001EF2E208|nr:hypothetical protein [Mycobacterium sp. CnD-18-1]MCG7610368.1 hypothetical protein [Mycobacterium sp. CnD-18-1]